MNFYNPYNIYFDLIKQEKYSLSFLTDKM